MRLPRRTGTRWDNSYLAELNDAKKDANRLAEALRDLAHDESAGYCWCDQGEPPDASSWCDDARAVLRQHDKGAER